MMSTKHCFIVLSVLAISHLPSVANADIIFGHLNAPIGTPPGELYAIDTVAQTVTLVGSQSGRAGPEMQMNPARSTIYMSARDSSDLTLIDPTTGLNTGTLGMSGFPMGTDTVTAMEFIGSTLYASFYLSGPPMTDDGILGTINTTTGAISTIGAMTGMGRPTGGLDFAGGNMYAVSSTSNNSSLFTINLMTGVATSVGPLTVGGDEVQGATALAFADGKMYTLLALDTNLYSVNLTDGSLTVEFDMDIQMNSLTAIPEPSSLAIISLCLAPAFIRRKRS